MGASKAKDRVSDRVARHCRSMETNRRERQPRPSPGEARSASDQRGRAHRPASSWAVEPPPATWYVVRRYTRRADPVKTTLRLVCPGRESNPNGLAASNVPGCRVCQFHHPGTRMRNGGSGTATRPDMLPATSRGQHDVEDCGCGTESTQRWRGTTHGINAARPGSSPGLGPAPRPSNGQRPGPGIPCPETICNACAAVKPRRTSAS